MSNNSKSSSSSDNSDVSEVFSVCGNSPCKCTSIASSTSIQTSEPSDYSEASTSPVHSSSDEHSLYTVSSDYSQSSVQALFSGDESVDSAYLVDPCEGTSGLSSTKREDLREEDESDNSVITTGTVASLATRRRTPNPIPEDFSLWRKCDPLGDRDGLLSEVSYPQGQPDYYPPSELSGEESVATTEPISESYSVKDDESDNSRACDVTTPEISVKSVISKNANGNPVDCDTATDILSEAASERSLGSPDPYGDSVSTEPYVGAIPEGRRQLRYRLCDTGYRNCCRPLGFSFGRVNIVPTTRLTGYVLQPLMTRVKHQNDLLRLNGEAPNAEYRMFYPGQIRHMVNKIEKKLKSAQKFNNKGDWKLDAMPTVLLMSKKCKNDGCKDDENYMADETATTIFNPVCCPMSGILAHPCISSGIQDD